MQSILTRYDIGSDFASVLLAFSEPPRISEQGYECFAHDKQSDNSYGALISSCMHVPRTTILNQTSNIIFVPLHRA
jgi:hypothetical protein